MKLNPNQYKAYAGGISSAGTFLASQTLMDNLTIVVSWLLNLFVVTPEQVAYAVAFLFMAFGSYLIGRLITYYAPPNQVTAGDYVRDMREHHREQVGRIEKKLRAKEPTIHREE